MTNKEKYGDKLIELSVNRGVYSLINGSPEICFKTECEDCDFYNIGDSCKNISAFREWLNSEYKPKVDWSKVAVDTPILVRETEGREWKRRYFAKYENGVVYAWISGKTSRSVGRKGYVTDWKYAKLAESEEIND